MNAIPDNILKQRTIWFKGFVETRSEETEDGIYYEKRE